MGGITKSLAELISTATPGTPDVADLLLFAPVPVTPFVTECKRTTVSDLISPLMVMKSSTRPLTDAEVIALPTTGVEVVPSPGPGKIRYPLAAFARLNWFADYSNIDAAARLTLQYAGLNGFRLAWDQTITALSALLASSQSSSAFASQVQFIPSGSGATFGDFGYADGDCVDKGIVLKINNQMAGDLAGGDPRNVLTVIVYYVEIEL